jgi:UDP-N-acetylmuramoyl-tripeptide--D-alanyl-D-alanine ligase
LRLDKLHRIFLESAGICTDTRKIEPNCLFFALKGENFDGNAYADEALEKGAYKVVIDDIRYHRNTGETILHGSALELLQQLATYHRNYLEIPIVALTGSNGKTTTKELIDLVLARKFKTTATKGNLNNHIGVPLTLLSMDDKTEMGIVEMGANHQKEIEFLSSIALPDYGLITNFGKAHLEGFGGVEGVIQGKSELYTHLRENGKVVFVNGHDAKQMELTKGIKRFVFGPKNSDCPVEIIPTKDTVKVNFDGLEIETHLIGNYNFGNIAAAIAIGHYFNIDPIEIKKAIASYQSSNNRSQLLKKNSFEVVLDAYNANPTSMMAALKAFNDQEGEYKIVILGDMFELGSVAAKEHQDIVDFVSKQPKWKVILIGRHFHATRTNAGQVVSFPNYDRFKDHWESLGIKKGKILLKGSRGMAMERVLDLL